MEFTKTTAYAFRVLSVMAEKPGELMSADYLHKEAEIPKKYLQRLLTDLSKRGLVESTRGKFGGFRLAKSSKAILLSEVVEAVEGFRKEPTCFFGFGKCINVTPCAMHDTWVKSQSDLIRLLSTTYLSEIIKK